MLTNVGKGRAGTLVVIVGLACTQACGGDEKEPLPPGSGAAPATGGTTFTGGTGGGGTSGAGRGGTSGAAGAEPNAGMGGDDGSGGEPPISADAPVVEITSPPEVTDPDDENVIVEEEVEVVCEVQPFAADSAPIDASTVQIELVDANGTVLETVPASPTSNDGEYSASVIVSQVVDNGLFELRCSASDTAFPQLTGRDSIRSLIDHGPRVRILTPEPGSIHAVGVVNVRFQVEPDPIASLDTGARVDEVALEVAGVPFDVGEPDDEDTYTVLVNFEDTMLFRQPPDGELPITVTARNRRRPTPAVQSASASIRLDGEGPTIQVAAPAANQIVGAQQTVVFTVHDELSAIDPESVVIRIGAVEERYDRATWQRRSIDEFTDEYSYLLDIGRFENTLAQATFQFGASDVTGNPSPGTSVPVYLDNEPPLIDLDPANVRVSRERGAECSKSFDPVGPAAMNDEDKTDRRYALFRSIVWDVTNDAGQHIHHFAGVNNDTVRLFIQPDADAGILVDSDRDGVCDDVLDTLTPVLDLVDLGDQPKGEAWFGPDDPGVTEPPYGSCAPQNDLDPPDPLCTGEVSDMTHIIEHTGYFSGTTEHPPAIYVFGPAEGLECTGKEFEHTTLVDEGWYCVAVRAEDLVKNRGVSRPLRVCYDDRATAEDPCLDSTPPSCTVDCTPPPRFGSIIIPE